MAITVKMGRVFLMAGFLLGSSADLQAQTTGGGGIGGGSGIGSGSAIGGGSRIGSGTGIGSGGIGGGTGTGVGGGMTGPTAAPGGPGRTAGGTGIPANSNVFHTVYGNPQATAFTTGNIGSSMTVTSKPFGQPIYTIASGAATVGAASASTTTGGSGFNTMGVRRNPPYATALSPDMPLVQHQPAQVRAELVRSLNGASFLKDKNIEVTVEGGLVILKGQVASERERRLAEGVVRLTPGVREVRNELVAPAPAAED
jgi:hypothetical protein